MNQPLQPQHPDPDYGFVHDVTWLEWVLADVLKLRIPRARCGIVLIADPTRPDPLDLGAPACPRCTAHLRRTQGPLSIYLRRRWLRREAAIAAADPATIARHALTEQQEPGSWLTVTVRDRIGGPAWALGTFGPIRTVDICAHCPRCGEPRGVPVRRGRVQSWTNLCGHRDTPSRVIDEAAELLLGARRDTELAQIPNQHNLSRNGHAHA
ncbi:hypothetical protein [Nocardia gipuzkoensis]